MGGLRHLHKLCGLSTACRPPHNLQEHRTAAAWGVCAIRIDAIGLACLQQRVSAALTRTPAYTGMASSGNPGRPVERTDAGQVTQVALHRCLHTIHGPMETF